MAELIAPPPPHPGEARLAVLRSGLVRLFVLVLLAGVVLTVRHQLLTEHGRSHVFVQRIKLVNPQPPAPPPRPREEPKAPDRPREEQKAEEPETRRGMVALVEPHIGPLGPPGPPGPPGAMPHGDQLGVDTEGEGAGDGFGLVARSGGRDITTLGGGGGRGSAQADSRFVFAGYGRLVAQRLQDGLQQIPSLVDREYVVVVLIWIDTHGRIVRNELPQSSGYLEVDSALRKALADARVLPEPPGSLPQPLKLRFTVREIEAKGG